MGSDMTELEEKATNKAINNKYNYWHGMPRFVQNKKTEYKKIICLIGLQKIFLRFDNEDDYSVFIDRCMTFGVALGKFVVFESLDYAEVVLDQKLTSKTKSIWYPFRSHWGGITEKKYYSNHPGPRFPVYIVSKGRASN